MVPILILFAVLFHTVVAVAILTLAFCGRLFRAEKPTLGRAAAVCGILTVLQVPLVLWSRRIPDASIVGSALLLGVQFLAMWFLIRWLLCTGGGKAALITLSWWVASTIPCLVLALLVRATVAEAFVVPTGAMAPAIYGRHVDKTCEACGLGFAVGASFRQYGPHETARTTCTNCRAPVEVLPSDPTVSGDRILVSKLDSPRRWDLIVFPPPVDPSTMYVKRLVGLPGESIEIRGGDLYADGRRLRKPPGMLEEFWLPVHDTDRVPREPEPEESPRWVSTGEPSRWTWQTGQGWRFQGGPKQRGELQFSHPVTDRFAYNAETGPAGRRFDTTGEPDEVPVPDLEIVCHVTRVAGSGVWGFIWEYQADRLTASIGPDGTVTLVHRAGESGQGDTASPNRGSVQGRLAATPSIATVRFAVRDGQAYLMQDRQLIEVLTLPDTPAKLAREDDARPVVKLFAEGGELQLSRIQLYRDVYYLTPEQVNPYSPPGIPNPVTLAADQYLVLGDNSRQSRDARFFGPITTDSVKGVVRCTYWPPSRVGTFVSPADPAEQPSNLEDNQ